MAREALRVALDFENFEIDRIWAPRLTPTRFDEIPCVACNADGYSDHARYLNDRWFGNAFFVPERTGSVPLTPDTPGIRELSARYGRDAADLCRHYNTRWMYHLSQEDVDALVAAGRLIEFTHRREPGAWKPIDPPPKVLAVDINRWSLTGIGHDAINCGVVVRARCEVDGEDYECRVCGGHASCEAYPGQRAEAEAWQPPDPPKGEGWQLWTTTPEYIPRTPVFASASALAKFCADRGVDSGTWNGKRSYREWLKFIEGPAQSLPPPLR